MSVRIRPQSLSILLGAALSACDSGSEEEATSARRSGSSPTRSANVTHLVERLDLVAHYDGPLLHLDPFDVLDVELARRPSRIPGVELAVLPWPPDRSQPIEVLRDGRPMKPAAAANTVGAGQWHFHPRHRRIDPASAREGPGDVRPVRGTLDRDERRLRPGETASFEVPGLTSAARLHLFVRALHEHPVALKLSWGDREILSEPEIGRRWEERSLELVRESSLPVLRFEVGAAPPDATERDGIAISILEVDADGPAALTVRADPGELRARYRPRAVRGLETFAPAQDAQHLDFLSRGGPLRLTFDGGPRHLTLDGEPLGDSPDSPTVSRPDMEEGRHRLEWSEDSLVRSVEIEQPYADLLHLLQDPLFAFDDFEAGGEATRASLPERARSRLVRRTFSGHDGRLSFLVPPPTTLSLELEVGAGDRLRFAFGIASLGTEDDPPTPSLPFDVAVARLEWSVNGERMRICEVPVGAQPGFVDDEWLVPESAAGKGVLTVTTESLAFGAAPVVFADPVLVPAAGRAAPRERPNLLLYVVDTLRADGLSCLGAHNPTTPTLDRLANEGHLFRQLRSTASWTRPAMGSLMTGLLPPYHGIVDSSRALPKEPITLAEVLRHEGLSTWAAVTNMQVGSRGVYFSQGFHRFLAERMDTVIDHETPPASVRLHEAALPWLVAHRDEPFFLYLHSVDPHMPYVTPPGMGEGFHAGYEGPLRELVGLDTRTLWQRASQLDEADVRYLRNVYEEGVHGQDLALDSLLGELERMGLREDTVLVLVADHGEELLEHGGLSHGGRTWDVHLRVPFLVWVPPRWREALGVGPPAVHDETVSLADVVPTLLDLLRIDDPERRQGRSFAALLRGEPYLASPTLAREDAELVAFVKGSQKYVRRPAATGGVLEELFDLATDPSELHDLAKAQPAQLAALRAEWEAAEAALAAGPHPLRLESGAAATFDRSEVEQLRALGYSAGGAPPDGTRRE